MLGEILEVFVNTLIVDGKYPVQYCKNLELAIQMQLSEKLNNFQNCLFYFSNLHENLNILKKKADHHRFRKRFDSEHVFRKCLPQCYVKS